MINEYIRDLKEKLAIKSNECLNYLGLVTEEFAIKNEYKTFNMELINTKCEIGMSEAEKVGKIFDL